RISERACAESAHSTAKQNRGHGEAGYCRLSTERFRQSVDGPVYDAAVETKKKPTDRGNTGKRDYINRTMSPGVQCRGRGGMRWCGAWQTNAGSPCWFIHSELFSLHRSQAFQRHFKES